MDDPRIAIKRRIDELNEEFERQTDNAKRVAILLEVGRLNRELFKLSATAFPPAIKTSS